MFTRKRFEYYCVFFMTKNALSISFCKQFDFFLFSMPIFKVFFFVFFSAPEELMEYDDEKSFDIASEKIRKQNTRE